jgi:hypothetical protein
VKSKTNLKRQKLFSLSEAQTSSGLRREKDEKEKNFH